MRKTRRILSIILTIALMLTMVQPNIFATDTSETSTSRGKVNMVYLGTSSSATDISSLSPQNLPDTSTWTADASNGTIFWVGITVSGMKTMDTTAANDSGRTSHFSSYANDGVYDWLGTGGIFNIASGIEYASEYIKPVYVSDAQMKNKNYEPAVMQKLDSRYANYTWATTNVAANIASSDSGR